MIRRENPHLGILVGDPVARNLQRERADLFRLQVGRRVVLRDDHAARLHIGEQLRLPARDSLLRVVGANAEHDGVETFEIFRGDIGGIQYLYVVTDLLKALRNLVTGAGNISDQFAFLPDVGAHNLRFRRRHQDVQTDVRIRNALARERVVAALDGHHGAQRSFTRIRWWLDGEGGEDFGVSGFQVHGNGRRLNPPILSAPRA